MADTTLRTLAPGVAISNGDLFISRQGADTSDKSVTGTQLKAFSLAGLGAQSGQATVDFGSTRNNTASVTVAAAWVTPTSIISPSIAYVTTANHSGDEALAEGLIVTAGNIVDGVSFDLIVAAPNCTTGVYKVNYIGV